MLLCNLAYLYWGDTHCPHPPSSTPPTHGRALGLKTCGDRTFAFSPPPNAPPGNQHARPFVTPCQAAFSFLLLIVFFCRSFFSIVCSRIVQSSLRWKLREPRILHAPCALTAAPNCPTGCLCMPLGRAIPHEASLARKVAASVSLRFPCPSFGDGESIGLVSYAPPAPLFGPRRGSSRGRRIPLPLPTLCPTRAS